MACFPFEVLCSLKLHEQFNAFAHVLGQTYEQVQRYHDLQFNISSNVLEYIKTIAAVQRFALITTILMRPWPTPR